MKYNCPWDGSTWAPKDLVFEKFFNFDDVKPGDYGEGTISMDVTNDAWICASVYNMHNNDNSCNEPEKDVEPNCELDDKGELQNYLHFKIWRDYNCDNIWQSNEPILVNDAIAQSGAWPIADSTTGTGPISGNCHCCFGVKWWIPWETGNIIQSDSLTGDIKFWAEQARNNPNYICNQIVRYPETGNAYIGYEE
jgi:hypothetical protein